jgi:VWFA-related protein
LKNAPAGERIAIFGLNNRLIMLQGFTTDGALLKAAVERSAPSSSALLSDAVGNGGTMSASQAIGAVAGPDMGQLIANVAQFEAVTSQDDLKLRVATTLGAMNQIAHFVAGIPGRKNLIWFSGSFPVDFSPESEQQYRETTNLLARSRVAVYPVGAKGLSTNATSIANDVGGSSVGRGLARSQGQFAQENGSQNIAMNRLAADTGGHAYMDTNGLSEAAGKAIDNGSNYYTLSYTPTNSKQDGGFRKIQIKVAGQGLTPVYRNGYFADEPEGKRKTSEIEVSLVGVAHAHGSDAVSATPAQANAFAAAMMRGAPPATGILMKLQVRPANAAVETAVVSGNDVGRDPVAKQEMQGPFRRYAIDVAVDAKDVQITPTPDGHYEFSAEVLTFVYDASGAVINRAALKARGNLSASTYANMRHTGLPFHQEISVPEAGEYYLRTAVHDLATDRSGVVEIPVASVAGLVPAAGGEQ